jgi:hypothetical protein
MEAASRATDLLLHPLLFPQTESSVLFGGAMSISMTNNVCSPGAGHGKEV